MPSFESDPRIAEGGKTTYLVERIKRDPQLAAMYEESNDEEIPHGLFRGHPVIGHDMEIFNGVYMGAGQREAIVVPNLPQREEAESVDAREINQLYMRVYDQFQKMVKEHDVHFAKANLLSMVHSTVREALAYDLDKSEALAQRLGAQKDGLISLNEYVKAGVGVCRHQALLTAYLLQRLQHDGIINKKSKISVDRNSVKGVGGHAWTRYTTANGDVIILDPAQNYAGSLNQVPKDKWMYKRPEDNKSDETAFDEFLDALKQNVRLSADPLQTLESFVYTRFAMIPLAIIERAKQYAKTDNGVEAMTMMMKRRLISEGVISEPAKPEAVKTAETPADPEAVFNMAADRIAALIRAGKPRDEAIATVVDNYLRTGGNVKDLLIHTVELTIVPGQEERSERDQIIESLNRTQQVRDADNEMRYGYKKAVDAAKLSPQESSHHDPEYQRLYNNMANLMAYEILRGNPAEEVITRIVDNAIRTHDVERLIGTSDDALTIVPGQAPKSDRDQLIELFRRNKRVFDAMRQAPQPRPQPRAEAVLQQPKDEDLLAVDFGGMDMRRKAQPKNKPEEWHNAGVIPAYKPPEPPKPKGVWAKLRDKIGL